MGRGVTSIRVGIDTGGTFTDVMWLDPATGRSGIVKIPSTPGDPSDAIIAALGESVRDAGGAAVDFISHGTTVGTNALLEERGARTGLLVTEGFRGVAEVGEQMRGYGRAIFDRAFRKPTPLVPPRLTIEVPERVGASGEIIRALDPRSARAIAEQVRDLGVESVAICLLFSFLDDRHERMLADAIRRVAPELPVSISADVLPEIREYYRLSTTVINAYLRPGLGRYLSRLEERLAGLDVRTPRRYVMQSNGGMTGLVAAADRAATTVLSGPAAGVTAAIAIAGAAGRRDLVTFDMGGTSCDVALVVGGQPGLASRAKVGGRDLAVPMLDIHTVSAGGGTTARVEHLGTEMRLAVGPRSAGARPGPVAYGQGGTEPTITDAHVVLGTLGSDAVLGGRVRLDRVAAAAAIRERIAEPLGLSVEEAAAGILRIIDVQMAEAIRAISTRRGHDLRGFTLVAFGGAGPLHAAQLARDLGIREVLVPSHPGVTSASGLLMADVRHDRVRSRPVALADARPATIESLFAELEADARAELRAEGFADIRIRIERSVDCRYAGQGYELAVPIEAGAIDADAVARVRPRFDAEHERQFGHAAPDRPVELLSFRISAIGLIEAPPLPSAARASGSFERALTGERAVWLASRDRTVSCRVFARAKLSPGDEFTGPAVIEQLDATTLALPDQVVRVLEHGELLIATSADTAEGTPSLAMAGGRR